MGSVSSDSSLDDIIVDDAWKTELEIALLENATFSRVLAICQLRPVPSHLRRDLWRLCLNIDANSAGMSNFSEIFDLPGQEDLHQACESAANVVLSDLSTLNCSELSDSLPQASQLASDFESILTHFSCTYSIPFTHENGWVAILSTLFRVLHPIDRDDLHASFTSVCHRFVAGETQGSQLACSTFRLLLQYHEPELCSFLDSHKVGPEHFAKRWLDTLFAGGPLSTDVLLEMWDIFFQAGNPQFGMFVSLVLLINAKDRLMQKSEDEIAVDAQEEVFSLCDEEVLHHNELETGKLKMQDELLQELRDLPRPMQSSDLLPLVDLTRVYSRATPATFRTHYLPALYGAGDPEDAQRLVNGALSLFVSVEEILNGGRVVSPSAAVGVKGKEPVAPGVRFLLVDCRPADQYNAGHLATAFYLDTELLLSNPTEFNTSVQALLQTQQRGIAKGSKAVGEHIVFMGSGRPVEDRVANMVIAHFLRLNTAYVSMLDGGYEALHESLGPLVFDRRLVSHEVDLCLVCAATRGHHALRMATTIRSQNQQEPTLILPVSVNAPRTGPIIPPPSAHISGIISKFSNLLNKNKYQTASSKQQPVTQNPTTPLSYNPPAKPVTSYRNTAAVFSLDDNDVEDDEEFVLKPTVVPVMGSSPFRRGAVGVPPHQQRVLTSLEHCVPGQLTDFSSCGSLPEVLLSFACSMLSDTGSPAARGMLLFLEKCVVVVRERERHLLASLGSLVQNAFSRKSAQRTVDGGVSSSSLSEEKLNDGVVEVSIPLTTLTKITSNKRIPEVITFHYSQANEDLMTETLQTLRLHIPKAGDAVKVIKLAVFKASGLMEGAAD